VGKLHKVNNQQSKQSNNSGDFGFHFRSGSVSEIPSYTMMLHDAKYILWAVAQHTNGRQWAMRYIAVLIGKLAL
jgi:hypothetical protein